MDRGEAVRICTKKLMGQGLNPADEKWDAALAECVRLMLEAANQSSKSKNRNNRNAPWNV